MGVTIAYAPGLRPRDESAEPGRRDPLVRRRPGGGRAASPRRPFAGSSPPAWPRPSSTSRATANRRPTPTSGLPVIERSAGRAADARAGPVRSGDRRRGAARDGRPPRGPGPDRSARRAGDAVAPEILRTLLRGDLGFGGVTVSDALDMGGVRWRRRRAASTSRGRSLPGRISCCAGRTRTPRSRVEAGLARAGVERPDRSGATPSGSSARIGDLRRWLAGFDVAAGRRRRVAPSTGASPTSSRGARSP